MAKREEYRDPVVTWFSTLLYHHVGPPRVGTPPTLTVSPDRFARQVRWLSRHGYSFLVPSQLGSGLAIPERAVMITFDDGYADLAEHAFPVLETYGASATVFVVSRLLGGRSEWDDAVGLGAHRLLGGGELRTWARRGIELGAHSRTHLDLTRVAAEVLQDEVAGSRDLEAIGGSPVRSFAYPYGAWNADVLACVRRHFDVAFTTADGVNPPGATPHLLHRSMVQTRDTTIDLRARVTVGYSPLERARRSVGRLVRAVGLR